MIWPEEGKIWEVLHDLHEKYFLETERRPQEA